MPGNKRPSRLFVLEKKKVTLHKRPVQH